MFRAWLATVFPSRADESALGHAPDDALCARLAPQLVPATRPATVMLLPFDAPLVRAAIHEAKYHGTARAQTLLARALAAHLASRDASGAGATIVPVPLGTRRRRERGFNQVEEVARLALRYLGTPAGRALDPALLTRTRETASQVSLPRREREANMRGAFGAAHPLDPERTYLLLDDVLTTGATLQAAIDALTAAGARDIVPIALAH